jgi:hypothetical protein
MYQSTMIRPAFTPATIALMVLGFVVFWPLGLAMLGYIIFGDRLHAFKTDANATVDGMFASCRGRGNFRRHRHHGYTGNVAFDDWRKAELERLEEQRRKLEEMRAEFETYARELRRAKDQEDFDRFMNSRKTNGDQNGGPDKSGPDNGPTFPIYPSN